MFSYLKNNNGISLIEVVLVITIMAILASVAMNSASQFSQTAKTEETKQELNQIANAISGNLSLNNNGVRTDFGYVGDIGALPITLDNLNSNPGGYATWRGPYIKSRFTQISNDYKQDAWGVNYNFNGSEITSIGSGADIVKKIASSNDDLLFNKVSGTITDLDGTIPGNNYKDSLKIQLTYPNGSGNYTTKLSTPDMSGFFNIDSIPIGNHDIEIIYTPNNDTLKRFVSVIPGSNSYGNYLLTSNLWSGYTGGSGGGIEYVIGSAQTQPGICNRVQFDIINATINNIVLTDMVISWSGANAYYEKIKFNGPFIFDQTNPKNGSGDIALFISAQTITPGETAPIRIENFKNIPIGGSNVNMNNVDFIITFSDGSTINFNSGLCL